MIRVYTTQKMKFSIKDFLSKCDQIRSFLRIWSHYLKKSLMENFIFCVVLHWSKGLSANIGATIMMWKRNFHFHFLNIKRETVLHRFRRSRETWLHLLWIILLLNLLRNTETYFVSECFNNFFYMLFIS